MQCPFLRKLNVKYCGLYGQKLIPLSAGNDAAERCLSLGWRECKLAREQGSTGAAPDRCPHLCVEDVHYCDLAPVRKLVPCNRAASSRCGGDGHRYCDLYLAMAEPHARARAAAGDIDGIPLPDDLAYAPNHLWLDDGDGDRVHVGVDAFFTRTLGRVEAVTFPARRAAARPSVQLRVGGLDLEMILPLPLRDIEPNAHLAVAPNAVCDDPYGRGWLFAGVPVAEPGSEAHPVGAGPFLRGPAARRWLYRERERLDRFVHACLDERQVGNAGLATDGGPAADRLSEFLDRRTMVRLHHEFFALRDGGHTG
jgi:glycine cleavage system H lipoate-binding protein